MRSALLPTRFTIALVLVLTCAPGAAVAAQGSGDSNQFALRTLNASAVGRNPAANPRNFVGPCTPNPFNPSTSIHFGIAERGPARLTIYDLKGRVVRVLVDVPDLAPGTFEAEWDGRDGQDKGVASGVYLSQLRVGEKAFNAVMMLVR